MGPFEKYKGRIVVIHLLGFVRRPQSVFGVAFFVVIFFRTWVVARSDAITKRRAKSLYQLGAMCFRDPQGHEKTHIFY